MRRRLFIPEEVKSSIRQHLRSAIRRAVSRYNSSSESEDALTGALGMAMETGVHRVIVSQTQTELPGEWKWSIRYYKFRGTGPKPTEHYIGADGVFELNLSIGSRQDRKSLLFQAKQEGEGGPTLFEQAIRLTTWREAGFVLIYSDSGYRAVPLEDVIANRGRIQVGSGTSLDDYLGDDFLDCLIGDNDLLYDGKHKRLIWRAMNGEVVATQSKHRMSVHIESPRRGQAPPGIDRMLDRDEIHQFRMQADEADLLNLREEVNEATVKRAKKRLALAFHPDPLNELDLFLKRIIEREMQEINVAADRLSKK